MNKPKYSLKFVDEQQRNRLKRLSIDLNETMNTVVLELIEEALENWERGLLNKKTFKKRL